MKFGCNEQGGSNGAKTMKTGARLDLLWLLLVVVIAFLVRMQNYWYEPNAFPDEDTYWHQAATVMEHGPFQGIRMLVDEYGREPARHFLPPPIRMTYIFLLAFLAKTTGLASVKLGICLSFVAGMAAIPLVYQIANTIYDKRVALYAALFVAVSPICVWNSMRSMVESWLDLLILILLSITLSLIRNPRNLAMLAAFFIVGMCLAFTKAVGMLAFMLCAGWLIFKFSDRLRDVKRCIPFVCFFALSLLIYGVTLAWLVGGFGKLVEIRHCVDIAIRTNPWGLKGQSGPWYQLLYGFILTSPVNTVLFIAGATMVAFGNLFRDADMRVAGNDESRFLTLFVLTVAATAALAPNCQAMRYVSIAQGLSCIVAGFAFCRLVQVTERTLTSKAVRLASGAALAGLLFAMCWRDYNTAGTIKGQSPAVWNLILNDRFNWFDGRMP